MVMRRTLRFMLSQVSTDLSSEMRLSTSVIAVAAPLRLESGSPMGPQRFLRNSKGSGGGFMSRSPEMQVASLLSGAQEFQQLGAAGHCVLVAQVDQRLAISRLEQQVAREIGSVA